MPLGAAAARADDVPQIFTPLKLLDAERAALAVAEHRAIAAAIAARNQTDAERLARAHIHTTIAALEKRLATEAS
jgi:DNA-binding GntR family transcriptional regulator